MPEDFKLVLTEVQARQLAAQIGATGQRLDDVRRIERAVLGTLADREGRQREIDLMRVELAAAQSTIGHLSALADRWLALRDVPDHLLGAPGVPCIAMPLGPRTGDYINGEHADEMVAMAADAQRAKGDV